MGKAQGNARLTQARRWRSRVEGLAPRGAKSFCSDRSAPSQQAQTRSSSKVTRERVKGERGDARLVISDLVRGELCLMFSLEAETPRSPTTPLCSVNSRAFSAADPSPRPLTRETRKSSIDQIKRSRPRSTCPQVFASCSTGPRSLRRKRIKSPTSTKCPLPLNNEEDSVVVPPGVVTEVEVVRTECVWRREETGRGNRFIGQGSSGGGRVRTRAGSGASIGRMECWI